MAHLFKLENNIAKPNVETLLIYPFKEIWERDTNKDKSQAHKEFTFIEFMSSKKRSNPYSGYSDELRFEKLKKAYFNDKWEMDELIEKALIKINEFQKEASITYSYYLSVLNAARKLEDFFNTFDINERNFKTGLPVYKPGDITRPLIDTQKTLQNLNAIKEQVEQELFEDVKTKGNKTINYFEQ